MTVINAMKFNEREGAMISDSQSSTSIRKYDIAIKLDDFETSKAKAIIGGSGAADILYQIKEETAETLQQYQDRIRSGKDLAKIVAQVANRVKREYVTGLLESQFGLRERDLIAGFQVTEEGKTPIDQAIIQKYHQIVSGSDPSTAQLLQNGFLILTSDSSGIKIYMATTTLGNARPIARPYDSIGSGSDVADNELYDFFNTLTREQRDNVDPVEGIAALINATSRASERNQGVGGTPSLKVFRDNQIITPNYNATQLAVEIVKGVNRGFLEKDFQRSALDALIYQGQDFKSVETEMWAKAKNIAEFSRMLRGYKE